MSKTQTLIETVRDTTQDFLDLLAIYNRQVAKDGRGQLSYRLKGDNIPVLQSAAQHFLETLTSKESIMRLEDGEGGFNIPDDFDPQKDEATPLDALYAYEPEYVDQLRHITDLCEEVAGAERVPYQSLVVLETQLASLVRQVPELNSQLSYYLTNTRITARDEVELHSALEIGQARLADWSGPKNIYSISEQIEIQEDFETAMLLRDAIWPYIRSVRDEDISDEHAKILIDIEIARKLTPTYGCRSSGVARRIGQIIELGGELNGQIQEVLREENEFSASTLSTQELEELTDELLYIYTTDRSLTASDLEKYRKKITPPGEVMMELAKRSKGQFVVASVSDILRTPEGLFAASFALKNIARKRVTDLTAKEIGFMRAQFKSYFELEDVTAVGWEVAADMICAVNATRLLQIDPGHKLAQSCKNLPPSSHYTISNPVHPVTLNLLQTSPNTEKLFVDYTTQKIVQSTGAKDYKAFLIKRMPKLT